MYPVDMPLELEGVPVKANKIPRRLSTGTFNIGQVGVQ